MVQYRCAICGSPNVTRNERNEGFSYKKALVGTVVFGTVGAVAGINGKKDVVYICSDCGAELSQPMDMITKDKVETVLASPDVLVPILFPDMYDRFSYLRKERDIKRIQADSERLAALTNIISDQSNPLNISEAEFRQSAKEAIDAFRLLGRYASKYYCGTFNQDTNQRDFLEIPIKEEEAKQICSGLSRIKNIVYAISFYRKLIHDAYDLQTGLSRKELAVLMFVYVMMKYQEITMEDFYYAVTGDKLLNESIKLVFDMEAYTRRIAEEQKFTHSMDISFDTLYEQKAWFASLASAISIFDLGMFNHIKEDGTEYGGRFLSGRLRGYNLTIAKSIIKCEFALINDSVYFASKEKPNDVFEKNAPALVQEIRNKQDQINQVKASRSKITNSEISAEEEERTRVIESLRREISVNDGNIQKLRRIKLFGKKKAQTEIAMLNENNEKKLQQIEAVRKEIATIKDAQQMMIQEKLAEIDDQLCSLQQEMSALDQRKAEFMKSIPEWVFIGGTEQQ